jgi:hypothetical protein
MNQQQIIGTAFEYAAINSLSARLVNDLEMLTQMAAMYNRPISEIKQLSDTKQLLKEYHFTYNQSTLEKFITIENNKQ